MAVSSLLLLHEGYSFRRKWWLQDWNGNFGLHPPDNAHILFSGIFFAKQLLSSHSIDQSFFYSMLFTICCTHILSYIGDLVCPPKFFRHRVCRNFCMNFIFLSLYLILLAQVFSMKNDMNSLEDIFCLPLICEKFKLELAAIINFSSHHI